LQNFNEFSAPHRLISNIMTCRARRPIWKITPALLFLLMHKVGGLSARVYDADRRRNSLIWLN